MSYSRRGIALPATTTQERKFKIKLNADTVRPSELKDQNLSKEFGGSNQIQSTISPVRISTSTVCTKKTVKHEEDKHSLHTIKLNGDKNSFQRLELDAIKYSQQNTID